VTSATTATAPARRSSRSSPKGQQHERRPGSRRQSERAPPPRVLPDPWLLVAHGWRLLPATRIASTPALAPVGGPRMSEVSNNPRSTHTPCCHDPIRAPARLIGGRRRDADPRAMRPPHLAAPMQHPLPPRPGRPAPPPDGTPPPPLPGPRRAVPTPPATPTPLLAAHPRPRTQAVPPLPAPAGAAVRRCGCVAGRGDRADLRERSASSDQRRYMRIGTRPQRTQPKWRSRTFFS
jgi:hypothetical protein